MGIADDIVSYNDVPSLNSNSRNDTNRHTSRISRDRILPLDTRSAVSLLKLHPSDAVVQSIERH